MITRRQAFQGASAVVIGSSLPGEAASWFITGPQRPIVGASVHFRAARQPLIDSTIGWGRGAGLKIFRWDMIWADVEKTLGVYAIPSGTLPWEHAVNYTQSLGIDTMAILDYGNPLYASNAKPIITNGIIPAFLKYCTFVVNFFYPRIKYFEIWNEWDNANGGAAGGTPEQYVDLCAAVVPALKAIAPQAKFLVGGSDRVGMGSFLPEGNVAPNIYGTGNTFFKDCIDKGLLTYAGDGLSIHPYCRWEDTIPNKLAAFSNLIGSLDTYIKGVNGGTSIPLYITECGWPTSTTPPVLSVTQADQASLITGTIDICTNTYADLVKMYLYYDMVDLIFDQSQAPFCYGLIDGHNVPKLSYAANDRF